MSRRRPLIVNLSNIDLNISSTTGVPGMTAEEAQLENQINRTDIYMPDISTEEPVTSATVSATNTAINQENAVTPDIITLESRVPRYWIDGFGETDNPRNWPATTVLTEEEQKEEELKLNWYDEETDDYKIINWSKLLREKIKRTSCHMKDLRDKCRNDFLTDIAKKNKILPLSVDEEFVVKDEVIVTNIKDKIDSIETKIKKLSEKIELNQLKEIESFFNNEIEPGEYLSAVDLTKSKWFGFIVNNDLINLWHLVNIPIKLCKIYKEEEVKKEEISQLLGYISEICVHTRSKQALYFVKYFAEGSRHPSKKNKRGFSEYKRTFGKVLDQDDRKSYNSVSMMLSTVLNVKCAFKNRLNYQGKKSINLNKKETEENETSEFIKINIKEASDARINIVQSSGVVDITSAEFTQCMFFGEENENLLYKVMEKKKKIQQKAIERHKRFEKYAITDVEEEIFS